MSNSAPPRFAGRFPTTRYLSIAIAFLVASSAIAAAVIAVKEAEVQRTVFTKILQQKVETTRTEFELFFDPILRTLDVVHAWDRGGVLRPAGKLGFDAGDLDRLLIPLFEPLPQVHSLTISDGGGGAYVLARTADGWGDSLSGAPDFELRQAAWVRAAERDTLRGAVRWSGPHTISAAGVQTVTAALAWDDPDGAAGDAGRKVRTLVAAIQVPLVDLVEFSSRVPVSENGVLLLVRADGSIAWISTRSDLYLPQDQLAVLATVQRPEYQAVGPALLRWAGEERQLVEPFQFEHAGAEWWGAFYSLSLTAEPEISPAIGLIMPSHDLDARLEKVTDTITYILIGLVALSVGLVVMLATTYRRKLAAVIRRRRRLLEPTTDLRRLIDEGEHVGLEFKSTMRWNLHAKKPGKEIELAWLKSVVAYLNGEGGVILIGVRDDGSIEGLDTDQFKSDDKLLLHFNNLVKQHIGLEFAKYIHASIRPLEDGRVLAIDCDPAGEPAYLKVGEEEEFYVRVGPSSQKLPTSKIIDYLERRSTEMA